MGDDCITLGKTIGYRRCVLTYSTLVLDLVILLTVFLGSLWALSIKGAPRKAVDLEHIILNGLPFKVHT